MNTIWNSLYVQADHPLVTATQIADHEAFHAKANRNGAEMIDRLAERIASMDRDAFDRVVDKYAKALETIYDTSDYDAFMRIVAEEMLADAYSGINAFGAHAEQFGDTVNKWMDEHFMGKKSEAEMEQLRGPPEGSVLSNRTQNTEGEQRFSITDKFTANDGTEYKNAVLLDTDFFDGISPRDWGNELRKAVEKRAENDPFILPVTDEAGNTTMLQFASKSDTVSKNGSQPHFVLNELSSTSDNLSKLAVIHIDEIIDVSEENNPYYSNPNGHGWMDKNGWLHRNANVINAKNGNIYNLTVDIAKADDGRTIMYATKGKIKKVGTVKVNSLKIKGSRLNPYFDKNLSQPTQEVKQNFSVDDAEYLRLAENPAQNYDRLNEMVRQAAEDAGYTDEVNHGTKAFGFTVIDTNTSDDKLFFFASKHRDTAQTYSGETSRDSIGKDRHVNYAELYDLNENQYLDEVRKLFPDVKYATDDDLAPRIENINRAFDTDMEMLYLSSYVFDSPEETAQVQKLVDAVRGMKTATNSEQLEAAISDFHAALDDTRKQFGDELYSDLLDAVKMTREAYQAKEEVFDYDWLSIGENAKMPILISRNKMTEMLVAEGNKGIYRLYANTSGMFAISGHGASWHAIRSNIEGLPEHSSTRAIAKWAFDHGYRGVIYNDIYDAGSAKYKDVGTDTVYAFFDPQTQLKSADIVTYDDNGQIIPLSERFNAANDDIRFSADDSQAQERNQEQAKAEGGSRNGSAVRPEVKATYAKNNLRAKVQTIFSIQPGNRSVANDMINDVTDRYLRNGYISEDDRQNFFDRLVEMGTVTVPAEESYREAREYLRGGKIYVEPSVVADFGDDWADKNMRDFHVDFQNEK